MLASHGPQFTAKAKVWQAWDREHGYFWPEFVKYADQVRAAGMRKSSAWLVINQMRWQYHVVRRQQGDEYGIPNDHIAFYARRYMASHPSRYDLFNVKRMSDENMDRTRESCGITRDQKGRTP